MTLSIRATNGLPWVLCAPRLVRRQTLCHLQNHLLDAQWCALPLFRRNPRIGTSRQFRIHRSEITKSDCIAFASSSFLGEVHFARGDIAAAIATYERFLELNTDPRRERIADAKLRRKRTKLTGTRRTEPVKATGVM
jgi:hypothetical protein